MVALVSHLWQSTVFAVLAGLLTLLFGRNRASVRYWIWFAALLKFLIPFALLMGIGGWFSWLQAPSGGNDAVAVFNVLFRSSPLPSVPKPISTIMVAAWLAGAVFVLARWAREWQRLAGVVKSAEPIVEGPVYDALQRLEQNPGRRARAALVCTSHHLEPGVIGIWTPTLVWPRHLSKALTNEQTETIVAHEVVHITRRDNLLACVQMIATAAFWFHPIVWWIGSRLIEERERACDERVVAQGQSPAAYSAGILKICIQSPLAIVSGVTGGRLKQRIARIMRNEPAAPLDLARKIALLLAVLFIGFVPMVAGMSARLPRHVPDARPSAAGAPVQDDADVHRPGGDITTPRLIREVKPDYSERAKNEKIQGDVMMECVVKADGTIGDVKIVKTLDPELDQAAMEAAKQWLFDPGTRGGKPVNVLVTIQITFTLK